MVGWGLRQGLVVGGDDWRKGDRDDQSKTWIGKCVDIWYVNVDTKFEDDWMGCDVSADVQSWDYDGWRKA